MPRFPLRHLAALVLWFAAGAAAGGPCASCAPSAPVGWWDDRPLHVGGLADETPRIDVDGTGAVGRVAITWERRRALGADIWLAISDDGGCTWMQQAVTDGVEDDRLPDVAVSLTRDMIALTFIRDGLVVATVSRDGGRTFPPPVAVDPLAPTDAMSRPRLGMIATGTDVHLHVTWVENGRIRLARDLGTGTWLGGPPLSDRFRGFSSWTDADIAADTRSFDPATASAVTLIASGLAPGSTVSEIFALRSNDSGVTFFGDPETPATLDVPRRVSEPRMTPDPARGATRPVLDVSDDGSGEFYTWEAVGYTDAASGQDMRSDARAEEGSVPGTIADWNDTGTSGVEDLVTEPGARAAAVSVIPNPLQRPPSPECWFFAESEASGTTEIVALRTMLDTSAPGWIVPTCGAQLLTGQSPPRLSGGIAIESLAADEDLSHVFVTWTDSRDGGSSVYWKRTDSVTAPATAVAAVPGDCATGGGIAVTWQLPADPPHCDIDRVRIEWAFAPGGLDGFLDVAPAPPAQVTGFRAGVAVWVRVVVVDEACNEAPSAEAASVTATCGAVLPPNPVGASLRVARSPSRDDVALTWGPPPVDALHDAATSYDVYRSITRARDGFVLLAAVAPPEFVDAGGAAVGTARLHCYLVVSRNSAGTSGDEPLP